MHNFFCRALKLSQPKYSWTKNQRRDVFSGEQSTEFLDVLCLCMWKDNVAEYRVISIQQAPFFTVAYTIRSSLENLDFTEQAEILFASEQVRWEDQ